MRRAAVSPLGAILVLWLLGGCGGRALRPAPSASGGPAAASAGPSALRASFRGRVDFGAGRRRFEGALALKAPDRLYVEIAGPVGGTRAVLAARGGRVVVLLPRSRRFLDEEGTPDTYQALLGLRLDTAGIIDLLRAADAALCSGGPCVRRIPLASGATDPPRELVLTSEAQRLSARVEPEATEAGALREVELRLQEAERPDPAGMPDDLFLPSIPAGWRRLDPESAAGQAPLLLP